MERAKGIEPSSAAWEAAALPLSYARPFPKDGRLPRRANNPPGGRTEDLSRDRPPCGSQRPFGPGRSLHPLSEPLQLGVRFFRDPLPTTDARQFTPPLVAPCGATPLWAYPVPCGEHGPGGPRLSAGDRHVSVPPPSREATGHVPFWFEPVSRFGSFKLDGIYQRFTNVGPLAQPCASSGFRLPESHGKPHGCRVPQRGGYVVGALGTGSLPTPHCT